MPRLPSAQDLGQRRISESGRPMAQWETGEPLRATERLGRSITGVGGDLLNAAARTDREDDRLKTARADAAWLTEDNERLKSYKDDDPEYATWGDRYQKDAEEARKRIAEAHIQDPRAREVWMLRRQGDVVRGRSSLEGRAEKRNRDYYYSTGLETLDNLKKTYAEAGDDEERRKQVIEAGKGVVEDMRRRGIVDDNTARTFGQSWAANVAETEITSLSPLERIAVLGGNRAALRARESGNNPAVVNQFGYAGLYQYGAPRLASIGVYQPGEGENLGTWSKTGRDAAGKWSGRFNIPGFPEVKTLEDFRRNEAAQERVAELDDAKKDQEIATGGLEKYIGQTVGGVPITREGIRNMIHLGGLGGAKRALESGGSDDRADANGTSVLEYARLGAGATSKRATRMAEYIAPERRQALSAGAEREYAADIRQQDLAKRQQSADMEALKRDDLMAVENRGQGLAPEVLSRDKIAQIQGEEAAKVWEEERKRAERVFAATDGVQTLPEGEIYRRLETLEPRSTAEGYTAAGYSSDMLAYERARKRADNIVQARRNDPALASEAFDTVKRARADIQYDENNGVRAIRPESAQAIIGARLAAQSQMGLEQPMAVTKSEAAVIARNLRVIGEENPDGLRKFMEGLNRTYGDYADEVLAATIQHANVNRDLSVVAAQMLSKIATGTMPKTTEMRNVDTLIDAAGLDSLMKLGAPETLTPELRTRRDAFGTRQQMLIREQAQQQAVQEQQQATDATRDQRQTVQVSPEAKNDVFALVMDNAGNFRAFDDKYGDGASERMITDLMRRAGVNSPEELQALYQRGTRR